MLYEVITDKHPRGEDPRTPGLRRRAWLLHGDLACRITSYNVCYTKLLRYSSVGEIKSAQDVPRFGLKTAFMSNSFSVYKAEVFFELGCFPNNTRITSYNVCYTKLLRLFTLACLRWIMGTLA